MRCLPDVGFLKAYSYIAYLSSMLMVRKLTALVGDFYLYYARARQAMTNLPALGDESRPLLFKVFHSEIRLSYV